MKKYYIYIFLDGTKPGKYVYDDISFDYEPFYVGKGTGGRLKTSLLDRESPFKMNKINKIKKLGGEIITLKLYENLENIDSLEIEKLLISKIGRRDLRLGTLVNQTDGGDGRLNSPHSDETRLKISKTKKEKNLSIPHSKETKYYLSCINKGENNPMFGKKHSDEVRENQSLRVSGINHPMFGKKHDKDTLDKIKKNRNFNKEKNNEISRKNNSKSILQYDLEGNFIKEYESIKISAIETGLSESLIGKICRGVVKSPKKFKFKFKEESSNILKNSFNIKIGDLVIINNDEYRLVKRNKASFIVFDKDENIKSFRRKDYDFVWSKKIIKNRFKN
jgi:group I intron endonuclease